MRPTWAMVLSWERVGLMRGSVAEPCLGAVTRRRANAVVMMACTRPRACMRGPPAARSSSGHTSGVTVAQQETVMDDACIQAAFAVLACVQVRSIYIFSVLCAYSLPRGPSTP